MKSFTGIKRKKVCDVSYEIAHDILNIKITYEISYQIYEVKYYLQTSHEISGRI